MGGSHTDVGERIESSRVEGNEWEPWYSVGTSVVCIFSAVT